LERDKPKTPVTNTCSVIPANDNEHANSTPKNLISFKSVENLIMTLTRPSKRSTECQDDPEGYSSTANLLDLSPIQPCPDWSSSDAADDNPVTRFETAFGPDNQTVTRVFYADGIATDLQHLDQGSETSHTPIETHFDDSPPNSGNGSSFNRKNSLRHSVQNLFNRMSSKDRKIRRENTFSRRRSVGCNLDSDSSYGCTVGVYSQSTHSCDTPVSHIMHSGRRVTRSQNQNNGTRPQPPSYETLYPETLYPKPPINDKSKRAIKRKKSMSAASLSRSSVKAETSVRKDTSCVSDECRTDKGVDNVAVGARSLSMSDLAMTAPPVENELQKQCQGHLMDSLESKYTQVKGHMLLDNHKCSVFCRVNIT